MRIVLNAFSARRGGGQTYITNLLRNLGDGRNVDVYVLAPDSLALPLRPQVRRFHVAWPTENPLLRTAWEKAFLPGLLKRLGADVLFCPGGLINTTPPKGCKKVVTFQNMMPFDHVQRAKYPAGLMRIRNRLLERALLGSMRKADLVIFISEYGKSVIERRSARPLSKSVTIPHGLSEHFLTAGGRSIKRPAWLPDGDYLLYVSILDVYKNQLEVVRGFHLLKQRRRTAEKLVLVGHASSAYGERVRREVLRLGLSEDVIITGNIPYEELPAVYHHARLNIFASECENCPNILLEALGSGRPLLSSNRPPMPEFGGDAALYFDPSSPDDIAGKISSVIDDPARMAALAKKAGECARLFDWEKTARRTWDAILAV